MDEMPDISSVQNLLDQGADESLLTPEERQIIGTLKKAVDTAWNANLAEQMDESDLSQLADTCIRNFQADEESRREWFDREALGIRLLGVSEKTDGGAAFEGATRVVHPGLCEAVIQFQARAMAEIWPAEGPAKTVVLGDSNDEVQAQANRVEDYLNYLYLQEMPGSFEAMDSLLFRLPLSGSTFKKVYWCPLQRKLVSRFIAPGLIVVPYRAEDIRTTPRITHVIELTHNDLLRMQRAGTYRKAKFSAGGDGEKLEIPQPSDEALWHDQQLRDEIDAVEGEHKSLYSQDFNKHVLLEQMCYLDLKGFEDTDEETGEHSGIALPYIVTVERSSQQILSIRRNWDREDESRQAILNFVHYKFLPGFGFYGFGLLHVAGFLSKGETGALRALLDAANLANNPGGLRTEDVRVNLDKPVGAGEWRGVKVTAEELSKCFFPLPYKEPSDKLFELLKYLDDLMRRLVGTTEDLVGDNAKNVPVGTTLARIEQGLKPQVAIHRRLHNAMSQELNILARLCTQHMPDYYPYALASKPQYIKSSDFDDRVDVVPVSDPNIVSSMQRIVMAQALVEMAKEAPDVIDRREAYERLLQAMRVPHSDEVMVAKDPPPALDPISENMKLQTSQPVKAYQWENHQAHIAVHRAYLESLPSDRQKGVADGFYAHIAEHMAMDYYLAIMATMGNQTIVPNPLMGEQPLPPEFQDQVAIMAAQIAQQVRPPSFQQQPVATSGDHGQAVKDAAMVADIHRKDAVADSNMQRADAEALARMNRANAEQELALMNRHFGRGEALFPEQQGKQRMEQPVP